MQRVITRAALCAAIVVAIGGTLTAQLQTLDVLLMTHTGFTHIRGGTSTPVVPVGITLPASWGNGAIEWVPNSQYCVVASGVTPYNVFVFDFTNSVASPPAQLIGQGIGGGRGLDSIDGTNDILYLQNTPSGGRISVINAPVTPASIINPTPWADNLNIGNTDFMTSQDPSTAFYGGVANYYFVAQGATGGAAAAFATGNILYSARDAERDSATGYLYVAVESPDYVRQFQYFGGIIYSDLGNILAQPEIDSPQDVEFDPINGVLYCVAQNGVTVGGVPWGVQAGNDNAIITNQVALPPGTGYNTLGPPNGHGNSGLFANIALVGTFGAVGAQVIYTGAGCIGTSGSPFTLGNIGVPTIGTTFVVTMANGQPNSLAYIYLALGLQNPPLPLSGACNLYIDLASLVVLLNSGASPLGPLPLDATGAIQIPAGIPNDPTLIGQALAIQGAAADTGSPSLYVVSQGALLIFG